MTRRCRAYTYLPKNWYMQKIALKKSFFCPKMSRAKSCVRLKICQPIPPNAVCWPICCPEYVKLSMFSPFLRLKPIKRGMDKCVCCYLNIVVTVYSTVLSCYCLCLLCSVYIFVINVHTALLTVLL